MRNRILILLFIGWTINSFAQNVNFDTQNFPDKSVRKEALKLMKKGDKYFFAKVPDYDQAVNYYNEVYKINPNNAELNYKIGECLSSKNKTDGLKYFSKAYTLFKDSDAGSHIIQENMLLYGQSLHYDYQFDSAAAIYKQCLELFENTKLHNPQLIEYVENCILQCAVGDSLLRNPTRYVVHKLGESVNSGDYEFSPVVYFDTLAFTSLRPLENIKKKKQVQTSNIYASKKLDQGQFSKSRYIGEPFSSSKNEVITDISSNGKYSLISREGDIYYSVHGTDGKWSKMMHMESDINTGSNEVYACFSKDMQSVYFASDCPGGYGGFDIYRADLVVTRSGELRCENKQNLGENINSKFDEISVSFSNYDNTMYISSNCGKSMGGFDIFKSFPEADNWSPLVNMGYPLNSTEDEMHFVKSNKTNTAYFTKSDDNYHTNIYSVEIIDVENIVLIKEFESYPRTTSLTDDNITFGFEEELKISSYVMCLVKGYIRDTEDLSPASLKVDVINNKTLNVVASFETHPSNGMYSISLPSGENYGLILKDSTYLFCSQEIHIPGSSVYKIIEENIFVSKIDSEKIILLENVFFIRDSDRLNNERSQGELYRLSKLLNENQEIKIEIFGRFSHSSKVSEYLVRSGVLSERITTMQPLQNMRNQVAIRLYKN